MSWFEIETFTKTTVYQKYFGFISEFGRNPLTFA